MADATGRVALVTGASRGIGQAVAIELARRSVHVVLTARTQGGLEDTDDAIRALGGTATLLPLDLMDGPALDQIGPTLFERFRRLDILVSNAASLGRLTPVPHIMPLDWAQVVGVNQVHVVIGSQVGDERRCWQTRSRHDVTQHGVIADIQTIGEMGGKQRLHYLTSATRTVGPADGAVRLDTARRAADAVEPKDNALGQTYVGDRAIQAPGPVFTTELTDHIVGA